MPDREKVITALAICIGKCKCFGCWYGQNNPDFRCQDRLKEDALALLREQKQEPAIVRCKDCKHRPIQTEPPKTHGFSIEFPEGKRCPCCCDDGYYSWYPNDDWFCADGEKEEEDANNRG